MTPPLVHKTPTVRYDPVSTMFVIEIPMDLRQTKTAEEVREIIVSHIPTVVGLLERWPDVLDSSSN